MFSELNELSVFLAIEDKLPWAASIVATIAVRATDEVRFNYLDRCDERHDFSRRNESNKYSIFRVFFL